MKIFKWWHKLIFIGAALTVAALFLIVAFLSSIEDVQRWSLFSTMFFGLASVCLSLVALFISMQTFVKTNKQEQEKLENEANVFIVENSDEIQYIPLCIIASAFNRQGRYERKIYSNFNKLNNNLQKEVLNQLHYECGLVNNTDWIDHGLEQIRSFIKEYDLGKDLLYDNAKYYKRTYEYKNNEYDSKIEYTHAFRSDIFGTPKYEIRKDKVIDKGISFFEYLRYYLIAKVNENIATAIAPKPIDYLAEIIDFENIDEDTLCIWMMCLVDSCVALIKEKYKGERCFVSFPISEGNIETYEDRFLLSLSRLYGLSIIKK